MRVKVSGSNSQLTNYESAGQPIVPGRPSENPPLISISEPVGFPILLTLSVGFISHVLLALTYILNQLTFMTMVILNSSFCQHCSSMFQVKRIFLKLL